MGPKQSKRENLRAEKKAKDRKSNDLDREIFSGRVCLSSELALKILNSYGLWTKLAEFSD